MSISLSVKTAIYYIFLCSMHIQLLMWVKLWWVFNVCIGDIIVHMEPQGFMKILAGLVPQLNIWKNILHAFFHHLILFPTLRSITRGQGFLPCCKWSPGMEQDPDFWGRPQGQNSCIFIKSSTNCGQVSTSSKSTLKQPFPNIWQRKSQFNLRLETEMRISLDR